MNITIKGENSTILTFMSTCKYEWYICKLLMNYVLGKRIFNILNHLIFPAKIQISKPIDVSVFMFDLMMINMSSECEYHWYWQISACSTEYDVCDSFASLTRHQTSCPCSAGWYVRYQSIYIHITYAYTGFSARYLAEVYRGFKITPYVQYNMIYLKLTWCVDMCTRGKKLQRKK